MAIALIMLRLCIVIKELNMHRRQKDKRALTSSCRLLAGMPVSAKELHSWDLHGSRSSQSPAETQPATDTCSNTRLALPNHMSQCTQKCTMLNIRALSEEQRYNRRRSIEDLDPAMNAEDAQTAR